MKTYEIENILSKVIPTSRTRFLGVFALDQIPQIDNSFSFPLCFVSNTHPSTKPGEHWVALFYLSPDSLEFFDSYGLPPAVYGFSLDPRVYNHRTLQSLNSNVCGQYCIFYLYHRSRGKSLSRILNSFSTRDLAWNDKSVARFISKYLHPTNHRCHCASSRCTQSCLKRNCCNK